MFFFWFLSGRNVRLILTELRCLECAWDVRIEVEKFGECWEVSRYLLQQSQPSVSVYSKVCKNGTALPMRSTTKEELNVTPQNVHSGNQSKSQLQ